MSIPSNFQTVNHYRDLSWFQVFKLKSVTDQVINLDHSITQNLNELYDWQRIAHRIDASITASRPFYRIISDFLTLQFIKKWIIQVILPKVIFDVDTTVTNLSVVNTNDAPPTAPDVDKYLSMTLKAHQYYLANKDSLFTLINTTSTGPAVPKAELEKEIDEYFKEKTNLLLADEVVALPTFYHATKENNLIDIINKGHLTPGPGAAYGKGVYFSTEDEHLGYGKYTFAVDFSVISSAKANYTQSGWIIPSLWVAIKKDVPIQWSSVAHIIVDTEKDKQDMLDKLTNANGVDGVDGVDEAAIGIVTTPVLTRQASDIVRKVFQKTHTIKIPPNWKLATNGIPINKTSLPYVSV